MPGFGCGLEHWLREARHPNSASQVHRELFGAHRSRVGCGEVAAVHQSGVVDEQVESAEF
jgi:hypothetical protein